MCYLGVFLSSYSFFILYRCRAKRITELRLKKKNKKHGFPILVYYKSTSHPAYFHNLLWTLIFISFFLLSHFSLSLKLCGSTHTPFIERGRERKKCWCAYALYVINFVLYRHKCASSSFVTPKGPCICHNMHNEPHTVFRLNVEFIYKYEMLHKILMSCVIVVSGYQCRALSSSQSSWNSHTNSVSVSLTCISCIHRDRPFPRNSLTTIPCKPATDWLKSLGNQRTYKYTQRERKRGRPWEVEFESVGQCEPLTT